MSAIPQLIVRPEGRLLMDDKLEIKITGLSKQQKTTLHAVSREGNSVFESCCCYTSDDNGEVDLATHPSLAGSYTGRLFIFHLDLYIVLKSGCTTRRMSADRECRFSECAP